MATILVVEDNRELRGVLREVLTTDHDVHTTGRGEEAVSLARELKPDLVLMDLQLPSMSGLQASAWIKRDVGDIPIIALTALNQPGDADLALDSGCIDEYLAKPTSLTDIRKVVERCLADR